MSAYSQYRKRFEINPTGNTPTTLGQKLKAESDQIMERTWDADLQAKVCYIYDYYHDDQPDKKDHMTYEYTTKTRIDAKFFMKTHQSLDKDQTEYYLQFKPSQKLEFVPGDELYYFETDYRRKFWSEFPIGMYCDIANEKGVYEKWLIVGKEISNQFTKYFVLPVNYRLQWIERSGRAKIKRQMWGTTRSQSSYTIGVYRDRYVEHPDNQQKFKLPLNPITEKLWYNDDLDKTMRIILSAPTVHPLTWSCTKIENLKPIGIQDLTLYQNQFNPNRDYIEKDSSGRIIGMWADYYDYDSSTEPKTDQDPEIPDTEKPLQKPEILTEIEATSSVVNVGGSYKNLTVKIYDGQKSDITDITENCKDATFVWSCSISDEDWTGKVTWYKTGYNQMKLKFPNDRTQLGKQLFVKCEITLGEETIEATTLFGLKI